MRIICWSLQVPKACPALMTHQVWKPPESWEFFKRKAWYIPLQESWSCWSRWPCTPFQPGRELPWDLPQEALKWMQWPPKRSKARSSTWKAHFPWQHLQVQDHIVCAAITLFLTSHPYWNWPRAAPTKRDTFPCQITVIPSKRSVDGSRQTWLMRTTF